MNSSSIRPGEPCRRRRRFLVEALAGISLSLALVPATAAAQFAAADPQVSQALRREARGDREVAAFYQRRNYRPLWIENGQFGPQVDKLLQLLSTAEADGLNPRNYRVNSLIERLYDAQQGSPRELARVEFQLSRTFARYVQEVRQPRDVGMIYTDEAYRPVVPNRTQVLDMAAAAPDLGNWLESIGWMNHLYARLRGALAAQLGSEGAQQNLHVPSGPILRPGSSDPRVRLLRARLGLPADGGYDTRVVNAVRQIQRAHDIPADGLAGPLTLSVLNTGSVDQQRLLRLNLERARALPADLGRRYILVDAAAARLWMYENGESQGTMRVVVGKPTEPTPMMAATMRYISLNPYWNIPPDLVRERVARAVLDDGPGVIRARRYQILSDWTDNARIVDPREVNWRAVAGGQQEIRVRQLPGPDNAMGRMKFMFPNDLGVYLHDTPDRGLLREEARLFSAGCVRLEDAPRLAAWLFGRTPRREGSEPEQRVDLPEPIPVYIVYMTVAPEPQGVAHRQDVYNRDPVQFANLFGETNRRRRNR